MICQWEFQDPTDGGTDSIYVWPIFFRPKFQGISPLNMAKHMLRLRISICWILEWPTHMICQGSTVHGSFLTTVITGWW